MAFSFFARVFSLSVFSSQLETNLAMTRKSLASVVFLLWIGTAFAQEQAPTVRINDNSDWWSSMRTDEPIWDKPDPIRTPDATLEISGISLLDPNVLAKVGKKFGRAIDVERGDASTGRDQYCYVSSGPNRNIYLIFEFGEVDSAFYVFSGQRDWNGSQYCKRSRPVGVGASTHSGLRLGMTRGEVKGILGKPTLVKTDRILYVRTKSVKSTQEQLKRTRTYAPNMSKKNFRRTMVIGTSRPTLKRGSRTRS
jgi:hypothetical protein